MIKYIPLEPLVAEIERFKNEEIGIGLNAYEMGVENGKSEMCDKFLSFLDTLEVKEVDLDYIKKELDKLMKVHNPNGDFGWGTLYNVATHFYKLGLKAQKGEEV